MKALTSDSKLLLIDRSLIKGALTVLGLADNAVGLLVHGRPAGGHFEYSAGIFDNMAFEITQEAEVISRQADGLMPMGRVVLHLLDPATPGGYADYRGSYVGQGQRLALGANAAYLQRVRIGDTEFDLFGWGADIFFNIGPLTLEAEYNWYTQKMKSEDPDIDGDGWYVQGGYLFHRNIEVTARHQELDADSTVPDDRLRWTSFGFNIYVRDHNLKIQSDYTLKYEQGGNVFDNNVFQLQLQLDF